MKMRGRFLLTGTPGCGKTTLARKLAGHLKAELVDVNALVEQHKIYAKSKRGEKLVDLKKLAGLLKKILSREKNVVVDSHLLCEMRLPCERVFVLRCNPLVLVKRLEKRAYPPWKVRENAVSELIDYCAVKAGENYPAGKITEVDYTTPLSPMALLAKRKGDSVDWMREFDKVISLTGGLNA